MERFYFDANATEPPLPDVVDTVREAMQGAWGNPTSIHREGQRARHLLEEARRRIAESLGVLPAELVFCSGATEALNLLLRGLEPSLGRRPAAVFPGEHSACLNPLKDWRDIRWMPCELEDVSTVIQMAANNETGLLYDFPEVPGAVRIQALSSSLVRLEVKGPEGFEDRHTFHVAERHWPGPLTLVLPRQANCPVSLLATAGNRVQVWPRWLDQPPRRAKTVQTMLERFAFSPDVHLRALVVSDDTAVGRLLETASAPAPAALHQAPAARRAQVASPQARADYRAPAASRRARAALPQAQAV